MQVIWAPLPGNQISCDSLENNALQGIQTTRTNKYKSCLIVFFAFSMCVHFAAYLYS